MSCPPEAFLSDHFLGRVKAGLVDGGVLAVNVAARSPIMYKSALESICRAFPPAEGRVFFLKASDDDVNTVVMALKGTSGLPSTSAMALASSKGKKKGKGSSVAGVLRSRVKEWLLRVPGQFDDPLGLLDLADTIEEVP
jgi:spermidine synthase